MAVDIGIEASDRVSYEVAGETIVNKESPANASGIITSIDIWANWDITGLIVGTFYTTNGNTLKCRDSEAIAGTITAGDLVNKEVTIAVEIGDYIGCYWTGGRLERDNSGYAGTWYLDGENIDPDDEAEFWFAAGRGISLGGYIEEVAGWTGKISGVTNPAKIMGVDVANIAKVKGVA